MVGFWTSIAIFDTHVIDRYLASDFGQPMSHEKWRLLCPNSCNMASLERRRANNAFSSTPDPPLMMSVGRPYLGLLNIVMKVN